MSSKKPSRTPPKISPKLANAKLPPQVNLTSPLEELFTQGVMVENSFDNGDQMLSGVFDSQGNSPFYPQPLSAPNTLYQSLNYTPMITLNRVAVTQAYMTHGILQTAIDVPVLDGFRGGLIIKSEQLDDDDITELNNYLRESKTIHEIKDVFRWARLYGGAGLIINVPQDPINPLNWHYVDYPDIPLSFVAADRWELVLNVIQLDEVEFPYNYYGQPMRKDRVMRVIGKEAPSFLRPRLQGWGMSEFERMIRDINQFVKGQNAMFQLMDEFKIDVFKLLGFNSTVLSDLARGKISKRIFWMNYLKNYHRALILDMEDEYVQKQLTMSGWGEVFQQIMIGMSAACRMPMSKLFGFTATKGLSANTDDLENYNAMIEAEIREPALDLLYPVVRMTCRHLFGFEPTDLDIGFVPLRVLGPVEEEEIRTSKQNRHFQNLSADMLTPQEYMEALKRDDVFTMETEVGEGLRDPLPLARMQEALEGPEKGNKTKSE
jgi:phage-related protein (TIGR01555 family)